MTRYSFKLYGQNMAALAYNVMAVVGDKLLLLFCFVSFFY